MSDASIPLTTVKITNYHDVFCSFSSFGILSKSGPMVVFSLSFLSGSSMILPASYRAVPSLL